MAEKRKIEQTELEYGDPVISLQDFIDEDRELETTANAVLGGSDDQKCTYSDGYLPRQALYACSTCETTEKAGVCLACSLECHDGHELYELYTKRAFRCDCGNSKFPGFKCSLFADKDPINEQNAYNHNFNGTYCTCKRPYPDPEDDIEDEMIQCCVCEDWFHGRHLHGTRNHDSGRYSEMICHLCMKDKVQFLWYYNWDYGDHDESAIVDVESVEVKQETGGKDLEAPECSQTKDLTDKDLSIIDKGTPQTIHITKCDSDTQAEVHDCKQNSSDAGENDKEKSLTSACSGEKQDIDKKNEAEKCPEVPKEKCLLQCLRQTYESRAFLDSASFWMDDWREKLCACSECKILMKDFMFLYEKSDTVAEYEAKGHEKDTPSSSSQELDLLSGMNRVQQVEMIHGYNDMKNGLIEYLKSFAQENRVVTKEDIQNFFHRITEAKKANVEIPHSCR